MSRTIKGGKASGFEYWTPRPGNKSGGLPGKATKRATHKVERQQGNRAVSKAVREDGCFS